MSKELLSNMGKKRDVMKQADYQVFRAQFKDFGTELAKARGKEVMEKVRNKGS